MVFVQQPRGTTTRGSTARTQRLTLVVMINEVVGAEKMSLELTPQRSLCEGIHVDGDRESDGADARSGSRKPLDRH